LNSWQDTVFDTLFQYFAKVSIFFIIPCVFPILLSSFGEDAALMGAFSLILEKILSLDHIK